MQSQSPLYLMLDRNWAELADDIASLTNTRDDIFLTSDGLLNRRDFVLLWQGLGFRLDFGVMPGAAKNAQPIFAAPPADNGLSALAITFTDHLEGGQRVAELAGAYLEFSALLAKLLLAKAIYWAPGNLWVDSAYFTTTVEEYCGGGAFPVLSTVRIFWNDSDTEVATQGLHWFSGQELRCTAAPGDRQNWTRRLVRIVHDIAVNGPVGESQMISDLIPGQSIMLEVSEDGGTVWARICSETELS